MTNWAQTSFSGVTNGIKDVVTASALDPLQKLLDNSPWWLTFVAITAIAAIVGGRISALVTAVCLVLILWPLELWQATMDTLAAVLVATVIVVVLGVVVGVWMGRSPTADKIVRPFLDAAQTMPSFVYLVPFLALFSASRFTGIVAAIVYAAPVSIKIMADGIRGVSAETVEAARSVGSNTWQVISKVQLPMAVRSLTLATNQGLIMCSRWSWSRVWSAAARWATWWWPASRRPACSARAWRRAWRSCCWARSSTARPRPHRNG